MGASIEAQTGSPIEYGSEFLDITGIKNLFHYHKDNDRIDDIIQKVLRYHLSQIKDAPSKLDLEYMLLRRNHK